jgi:hypothetical protein
MLDSSSAEPAADGVRIPTSSASATGAMKTAVGLVALALFSIGPTTWIAPGFAAEAYGMPVSSPDGRVYLFATAVRDVALGCWLAALLWAGASRRLLSLSMFALVIVAAGDAWIVASRVGSPALRSLVPHVGGLVGLLAAGIWLARAHATSAQAQGADRVHDRRHRSR